MAPNTGRTAAVHVTNPGYDDLARLVDVGQKLVDKAAGDGTHVAGPPIRLTWLIHDMQVWRIDEVYAEAPGGPWIATRQNWQGNPLEAQPTWHRVSQPDRLLQALRDLKVLDPSAPDATYSPEPLPAEIETGVTVADSSDDGLPDSTRTR